MGLKRRLTERNEGKRLFALHIDHENIAPQFEVMGIGVDRLNQSDIDSLSAVMITGRKANLRDVYDFVLRGTRDNYKSMEMWVVVSQGRESNDWHLEYKYSFDEGMEDAVLDAMETAYPDELVPNYMGEWTLVNSRVERDEPPL